jgi:hypothetical protein
MRRRSFVGWMAALAGALGFRTRAAAQQLAPLDAESGAPLAALDPALLGALAAAILPSEIGADGTARALRGFNEWLSQYRGGAEVLHGYGTGDLAFLAASPATRWAGQLRALDQAARKAHGRGLAALPVPERQALVRSAIGPATLDAMPAPGSSEHVAVALMAWYYATPEATDLCYRAQIGKNRCRPIVNNPKEPAPLAAPRRSSPSDGFAARATPARGGNA